MRAEEIKDRKSFEAWLNERPEASRQQGAVVLAHRAAMRAMPNLRLGGRLSLEQHATLILTILRCHAISRVAGTYPTHEIASAAAASARAAAAFASASAFASDASFASAAASAFDAAFAAASAAAFASDAASASDAAFAAAFASDAASFASDAASASFVSWEEIRRDAAAWESGATLLAVMESPLWLSPPNWWQTDLQTFRHALRGLDQPNHGFGIWIEWYDSAAFGKPVFGIGNKTIRETLERNIALGSTDGAFNEAFWNRDPAAINADIQSWVIGAQAVDKLHSEMEVGPGTSWKATLTGYSLNYAGDASDAEVAASEETALEHRLVRDALAKLMGVSQAISERQGWEDFHQAVADLDAATQCAAHQLHGNILRIYYAALRLTTFLDQNNALRAARGANFAQALLAPESRLLLETITYVHPWVSRFPTARRKDSEAGQIYRRMTQDAVAAHVNLANAAHAAGLIQEEDRKLLTHLVAILSANSLVSGVPAEKLQTHGAWTIKNLVYAIAAAVALGPVSAMSEDVAKATQTYELSRQFLVRNVKIIEEVIYDAPANVQAIIKAIIESEKRETIPEAKIVEPSAIESRKRRFGVKPRGRG